MQTYHLVKELANRAYVNRTADYTARTARTRNLVVSSNFYMPVCTWLIDIKGCMRTQPWLVTSVYPSHSATIIPTSESSTCTTHYSSSPGLGGFKGPAYSSLQTNRCSCTCVHEQQITHHANQLATNNCIYTLQSVVRGTFTAKISNYKSLFNSKARQKSRSTSTLVYTFTTAFPVLSPVNNPAKASNMLSKPSVTVSRYLSLP